MIKAIIFDMDGLLIDSEPLWQDAEIEIFGKLGLTLTREMCEKYQGVKIEELIQIWYNLKPWTGMTFDEVAVAMIEYVKKAIVERGHKMAGVDDVIRFFNQLNLPKAIGSASSVDVIEVVLKKLNIREHFTIIHSSQFEKKGKPSPDVFLGAAKRLGVLPEECLVFEDSYNGVLAGKAAKMLTIAVPEHNNYYHEKFDIADIKLKSLLDFNNDVWLKANQIQKNRNNN